LDYETGAYQAARASIRPWRGIGYELARWFFLVIHRLSGWSVEDAMPPHKKTIIVAAPHTTNWDLIRTLGIAYYYRIPVSWMGKKSLGDGPFGWLMRWWGLLPVDQSQSNNLVKEVAKAYDEASEMILIVAGEGTRATVKRWRTGFYHIAVAANIPISVGFIDYQRKVGGVGFSITPTGDYRSDMEQIIAYLAARVTDFEAPEIIVPTRA